MNLVKALRQDVKYQFKYGFYFVYALVTAIYVGIVLLLPAGDVRDVVTAMIIVSDPCVLGFMFISGIWILEKGEGLQMYFSISPLKPREYIISKVLSLSVVTMLSAGLIILAGYGFSRRVVLLFVSTFLATVIFTFCGLCVATFARSVNHYLMISLPMQFFIMVPVIVFAVGFQQHVLSVFPSVILWRFLTDDFFNEFEMIVGLCVLLLWLIIAALVSFRVVSRALTAEGGGGKK